VQEPDPRTLARAREGDLRAFEDLVRLYQADAWRFAHHLTGNRATAEDVTQEAFLRAFRFLRSFRGDSKFSSWLFRIVRNCSMDALKSRRTLELRDYPKPPPATDPATRAEVWDAVRGLSRVHLEPFLLIEVFGLSYQEAADILQLRVGTVKSRMHRGRRVLVRGLSDPEDQQDPEARQDHEGGAR
jgi:RNA polymerase sigma-70 factor (ECF subfamily)